MPRVHLITYATPRFLFRQRLLALSARCNHTADSVTSWSPKMLLNAGFEEQVGHIRLDERGSGFWAWKPFVISAKLAEVPDGDIVFYCDVGRLYPFKLLDQPVLPFLQWMDAREQDIMPGILAPWDGTVKAWTKREALVELGMDRHEIHEAPPIQASFSVWRASRTSRDFVSRWMNLCSKRNLVSDDPSRDGISELEGFRAHRHDQALLTLCCLRDGIAALEVGTSKPPFDSRNPSMISKAFLAPVAGFPTTQGRALRSFAMCCGTLERIARKAVKFGDAIHE